MQLSTAREGHSHGLSLNSWPNIPMASRRPPEILFFFILVIPLPGHPMPPSPQTANTLSSLLALDEGPGTYSLSLKPTWSNSERPFQWPPLWPTGPLTAIRSAFPQLPRELPTLPGPFFAVRFRQSSAEPSHLPKLSSEQIAKPNF